MKWLKQVALVGGVCAALSCGEKPQDPDLITRESTAVGPNRDDAGIRVNLNDQPDAAVEFFDGGACCPVQVAIAAQGDETIGYATEFPSGTRVALSQRGGVWSGQLCFWLSEPASRYYFELGYSLSDEDAGIDGGEFLSAYVNRAAPVAAEAAIGEVNVFSPGGAATCGEVDAGIYGEVFDAGAGSDGG